MDYRITLLALGLVASAGVLVACGGNACDTYVDDAKAKFDECGISTQSTSAATGGGTCDAASAKLADCLDACLPKIDCGCLKDPTGADCATKLQPYTDCATACTM